MQAEGIHGRLGSGAPPDDRTRLLRLAKPNSDGTLEHLGVVGDTYTLLLTGEHTAGLAPLYRTQILEHA